MNARKITFILLAAALVAAPGIVSAQGGPGGPGDGQGGFFGGGRGHGGFGGGKMFNKLADKLDLSDEQQAEIEAIHAASREAASILHEQMREIQTTYSDVNDPGAFDETAARTYAEALAEVQVELRVHRMKTHADVWNVLTPEQQEKLKELMDFFGDRPRRGGRRGGPGGN